MNVSHLSRRRFLAVTASTIGTAAFAGQAVRDTWRGRALGAEAAITVEGPAGAVADGLRAAVAALRRAERLWSLHDPGSTLSRLNATGAVRAADPAMGALLSVADRVHHLTEGTFDPSIQPLWRALAEGGDAEAIVQARAHVGWQRVRFGAGDVRLAPGQALTFNGIAQGAAADLVVAALRDAGLPRALVNTGELAGFGAPWTIGIADPVHGHIAGRSLASGAIATSSPAAMSLGSESHILSRDGLRPLWSTVSVEADTATLADAVSTAACLMSVGRLAALRTRHPGLRRITLVDAEGDLRTV